MTESDITVPNIAADLDLPRVPQQARSRQKRDAILTAASRLFEERGYEATTTDDIAAAAEVSVGTLYSYFRNKRQVFLTLFANSFERILAVGIHSLDFGSNPRQAVREIVRRLLTHDDRDFGLRRAWLEIRPRDPELGEYSEQLHILIFRQFLVALRKAAAHGLTRPDLDVDAAAWAITLLMDRALDVDPRVPGPDSLSYERVCDAVADVIYRALFRETWEPKDAECAPGPLEKAET